MTTYRKSAHTVYVLHYHFVFVTKYRKPALRGDVAMRVRDLIREVCRSADVEILRGHVSRDHVHLLLSVPPHIAPSHVMKAVKGKTSHHLLSEFRALRKEFWGRHLWARGYFVASTGNVTDEVVAKYIATQGVEPQDDDKFKISP
jgi:putative transposase